MNSKEAIIDKILSDAEQIVAENTTNAQNSVAKIIAEAQATAKEYTTANAPKAEINAREIISRRKSVAGLDCRKYVLLAKKEIIDGVFSRSGVWLRTKQKAKYLELVTAMISNSAEDGDSVIICEEDKSIITEAFIAKLAKKIGKKITLNDKFGDFGGGIILSNASCDKNMTLDLELNLIREQLEKDVSAILFEEKN